MSDGIGCKCAARSEGECGCGVDWTPAEVYELRAEVGRLTKERDHWKANHDNQVRIKHALQDRPDLKERAASWAKLTAENTALRAVADAAETLAFYCERYKNQAPTTIGSGLFALDTALAAAKAASKPAPAEGGE